MWFSNVHGKVFILFLNLTIMKNIVNICMASIWYDYSHLRADKLVQHKGQKQGLEQGSNTSGCA